MKNARVPGFTRCRLAKPVLWSQRIRLVGGGDMPPPTTMVAKGPHPVKARQYHVRGTPYSLNRAAATPLVRLRHGGCGMADGAARHQPAVHGSPPLNCHHLLPQAPQVEPMCTAGCKQLAPAPPSLPLPPHVVRCVARMRGVAPCCPRLWASEDRYNTSALLAWKRPREMVPGAVTDASRGWSRAPGGSGGVAAAATATLPRAPASTVRSHPIPSD